MKYSDTALKILAAKECGLFKTKAQFWRNYSCKEIFDVEISKSKEISLVMNKLSDQFDSSDDNEGFICTFDAKFPIVNKNVRNNSEKPYLLFYKGNLSLLGNLNKNVAVIGLTDPDDEIIKREHEVVKSLVKNGLVIVSGLAKGCDTIAHKACIDESGKTIAILPTQINDIYPSANRNLAKDIVNSGGLLISEYYTAPSSRQESIIRFVERDRLQAMFAKAVILIASYRKGEGDSGSRHAMDAAKKYDIDRYVMFKTQTDINNIKFGLNFDLLEANSNDEIKVLNNASIEQIRFLYNRNLEKSLASDEKQLTFFDL